MSEIITKILSVENDEPVEKNKVGRAKGQVKGSLRKSEKWQPKNWRPVHDQMITLHMAGKSNVEISEVTGYTTVQVSNILNSNKGKELKAELGERTRAAYLAKTEEDQGILAVAAAVNIKRVLMNEELFLKAPLQIFDRSLKYLEASGKLTGNKPDQRTQNNIFLGADVAKVLAEGMVKAANVRLLHAGPPTNNGNNSGS